jgi:hypothetical protein
LENVKELVDKHCGRLRWDFQQRPQEVALDFRQTWVTKIDDTTQGIQQALERVRAQKQADSQATAARLGQLDRHPTKIFRAESQFMSLREQIEAAG